jgi:hypothetical protein
MAVLLVALSAAACSSDHAEDAGIAPLDTVASTTTTEAPTTTTTVAPTTTPAPSTTTTVAPTTTLDAATQEYNRQMGIPRPAPPVMKEPHPEGSRAACTGAAGGWGVEGSQDWSDGYTEQIAGAGPFTSSATHVATGARGSWVDLTIDAHTCLAAVHANY